MSAQPDALAATAAAAAAPVDSRLSLGLLVHRLPHINSPARCDLLQRLELLVGGGAIGGTEHTVELDSIRESPSGLDATSESVVALRRSVLLVDAATGLQQASVWYEGEEFFPVRLQIAAAAAPHVTGVEFRSRYLFEYRGLTEEDSDAQADLADQFEQCRRLLRELPKALAKSEVAVERLDDDADARQLGALVLEQKRLKKELAAQRSLLASLEVAEAAVRSRSQMTLHRHQSMLVLPIGLSRVGADVYHISLLPLLAAQDFARAKRPRARILDLPPVVEPEAPSIQAAPASAATAEPATTAASFESVAGVSAAAIVGASSSSVASDSSADTPSSPDETVPNAAAAASSTRPAADAAISAPPIPSSVSA
ncbi:MAG: hypothetical protein P4L81_03495 [Candidatus Pacebacteria bacterium]|nr:hypothetical protein [Candidatus Paceibacterota bacterium]